MKPIDIVPEYTTLSSLPIRERLKKLKAIAHEVVMAIKTDHYSLEDIDLYLKILNEAARFATYPQSLTAARSKLIAKKLALTGNDQAKIVEKKNFTIGIESGIIAVGDPSLTVELTDYTDKALLAVMNVGKRLYVGTGGDGAFDVQLRLIEATEPVLSPKEYKLVRGTTDTLTIAIPSGILAVGDLGTLDQSHSIMVKPGNYRLTAYLFATHRDFRAFYIVACPTDKPATNQAETLHTLE